jgi:hypothetical protein
MVKRVDIRVSGSDYRAKAASTLVVAKAPSANLVKGKPQANAVHADASGVDTTAGVFNGPITAIVTDVSSIATDTKAEYHVAIDGAFLREGLFYKPLDSISSIELFQATLGRPLYDTFTKAEAFSLAINTVYADAISRAELTTFNVGMGVAETKITAEVNSKDLSAVLPQQGNNLFVNNSLVGLVTGTPGTLPANWGFTSGGGLGTVTRTIVATGTSPEGVPYFDLRVQFTCTTPDRFFLVSSGLMGAASPGAMNFSYTVAIIAGNPGNIKTVPNQVFYNSSNGFISEVYGGSFPLGANEVEASISMTAPALTAKCDSRIPIVMDYPGTYDFTIRVEVNNLEMGSVKNLRIPTTALSGVVTYSPDKATGIEAVSKGPSTVYADTFTKSEVVSLGVAPEYREFALRSEQENYLRNSSFYDAVVGSVMPFAADPFQPGTTVEAVGIRSGVPYVRFRLQGTNSGGGPIYPGMTFGGPNNIQAGASYTASYWCQLVANAGTSSPPQFLIQRYSPTGFLGNAGNTVLPATWSRPNVTFVADANISTISVTFHTGVNPGQTWDWTIEIGCPMLQKSATLNAEVYTYGRAYRQNDYEQLSFNTTKVNLDVALPVDSLAKAASTVYADTFNKSESYAFSTGTSYDDTKTYAEVSTLDFTSVTVEAKSYAEAVSMAPSSVSTDTVSKAELIWYDRGFNVPMGPNLLANSGVFTSSSWIAYIYKPALTSGEIDPDGGTNAFSFPMSECLGAGQWAGIQQTWKVPIYGDLHTSLWVKADQATVVQLGTRDGAGADFTATTTWTRVAVFGTRNPIAGGQNESRLLQLFVNKLHPSNLSVPGTSKVYLAYGQTTRGLIQLPYWPTGPEQGGNDIAIHADLLTFSASTGINETKSYSEAVSMGVSYVTNETFTKSEEIRLEPSTVYSDTKTGVDSISSFFDYGRAVPLGNNLLRDSSNFASSVWSAYWLKPTLTAGETDPFGGTNAYSFPLSECVGSPSLNCAGVVQRWYTNWPLVPFTGTLFADMYVRADQNVWCTFGIQDGMDIGFYATTTWQRISKTGTRVTKNGDGQDDRMNMFYVRKDGLNVAVPTTCKVYIAAAQTVRGSTQLPYEDTTIRPFGHDVQIPVDLISFAASNVLADIGDPNDLLSFSASSVLADVKSYIEAVSKDFTKVFADVTSTVDNFTYARDLTPLTPTEASTTVDLSTFSASRVTNEAGTVSEVSLFDVSRVTTEVSSYVERFQVDYSDVINESSTVIEVFVLNPSTVYADNVTKTEYYELSQGFGRTASDTQVTSELTYFAFNDVTNESSITVELIYFDRSYNLPGDTVSKTEAVSLEPSIIASSDTVGKSESATGVTQDYIAGDYFAEDYASTTFTLV